jgi:serine protease AprX
MARTAEVGRAGWKKLLAFVAALTFVLCVVPASDASGAGGAGKLSGEVAEKARLAAPDDLLRVIIQTVGEPSQGHYARLHGRGGAVRARHAAIRGYSATVPASQIETLADDPEIERVSFDTPISAHLDVAYKAVAADVALFDSGGLDGRGVAVAVVDTGVQGHNDLLKTKGSPPVIEVEIVGQEPGLADYYGHGTHVAGIIAGSGLSSSDAASFRTFRGIAPGAQIISLRALYPDGTGYTSDILAAIDWVIRFQPTYNIRVLNLSLGHPVFESYATDPLCRAIRAAHDAGILVVVAAGNEGHYGSGFGTINSPGNEPTALTVGALDDDNTVAREDDVLAWYSSKGPSLVDYVVKPDVVAPGTWIVSLRAAGSYLDTNYHDLTLQIGDYKADSTNAASDGAYYSLAGTSMAAPMVAGAAALLFQKDPGLNPATVKARIMKSAVEDDRLVFETGAGHLDVAAALKEEGYAQAAPSPQAVLASDGYIYVGDTAIIWGDSVWSLGAIWKKKCILTGELPEDAVAALGAVWGGRTAEKSVVENDQVTADGLIWNGGVSSLSDTTSSIEASGAVWRKK